MKLVSFNRFAMAKFDKRVLLLLPLILILSSWLPISNCSKKPAGVARKEDIPYIKCQLCEKLAHQLYQQVQAKQAEISPKKVMLIIWALFMTSFSCCGTTVSVSWINFNLRCKLTWNFMLLVIGLKSSPLEFNA